MRHSVQSGAQDRGEVAYSYNRRNEIARSKGFASYSEYRRATEFANKSTDFTRATGGKAGGMTGARLDEARLFYQAFKQGDKNDYRIRRTHGQLAVKMQNGKPVGAKAKWFVDVEGLMDADTWRILYPRGRRD